jgi:hypothetical protein
MGAVSPLANVDKGLMPSVGPHPRYNRGPSPHPSQGQGGEMDYCIKRRDQQSGRDQVQIRTRLTNPVFGSVCVPMSRIPLTLIERL